MLRAAIYTTIHVVYCSTLSLSCQLKGTHTYASPPALVDSDPCMHIQAASKDRVSWYSCYLLVSCQKISNDRLELLSKIRTPKLREWGTNCLGQISYFLFYPSSGTAGSVPRPIPIRVRRHGPPRGFNVTTRSKGLPRFHFEQPTWLRFYVCCGPSHGRPNR